MSKQQHWRRRRAFCSVTLLLLTGTAATAVAEGDWALRRTADGVMWSTQGERYRTAARQPIHTPSCLQHSGRLTLSLRETRANNLQIQKAMDPRTPAREARRIFERTVTKPVGLETVQFSERQLVNRLNQVGAGHTTTALVHRYRYVDRRGARAYTIGTGGKK